MANLAPETWSEMAARLPVDALIGAGFAVVVGLILWLFGRRILRPAFVIVGATVGTAAGYVAGLVLPFALPVWAPPVAGAILFALLAWGTYRLGIGLCMAAIFGVVSPLLVLTWAGLRGVEVYEPPPVEEELVAPASEDALTRDLREEIRTLEDLFREADNPWEAGRRIVEERTRELLNLDDEAADTPASPEDVAETEGDADHADSSASAAWAGQFDLVVREIGRHLRDRWESVVPGVRRSILLSAACGAIFGLLLGLSLPAASASIITAIIGSGLILMGSGALLVQVVGPEASWLPRSPGNWLAIWAGASLAGVGFQWMIRARPADTSP